VTVRSSSLPGAELGGKLEFHYGDAASAPWVIMFLKYCGRYAPSWRYWTVCVLPLLVVMLTLYTGYESDFVVYLFAIFVLSQATFGKDSFTMKAWGAAPSPSLCGVLVCRSQEVNA
jgi:hypothetical protein